VTEATPQGEGCRGHSRRHARGRDQRSPAGGADDAGLMAFVVETWRSMLPAAAKLGLVTDDFVDPDALLPRLREEAATAGAVVTTPALISARSL
jgi:hypothetical protein